MLISLPTLLVLYINMIYFFAVVKMYINDWNTQNYIQSKVTKIIQGLFTFVYIRLVI